jgi:hypothetical protein
MKHDAREGQQSCERMRLMRWGAALVMLAACKRGGEPTTTPLPELDVSPDAGNPVPPPPAPRELLGLQFEPFDVPPASAPSGAPVQVKFVAAKVGATRTRSQTQIALFQSTQPDGTVGRLQETQITFVLREEVQAVSNNRVKRIGIAVEQADEVIVLAGKRHTQRLLDGTYTVDVGGLYPKDMKISAPGRRTGTREDEELSQLISMDAASTTPFHELVWLHPLRVGEAVVLTRDEMKALLAGESSPGEITFSLRKLQQGDATYQLDTRFEHDGEQRVVRQRYTVRVASGQVVELVDATHSIETSSYGTHESKTQTTMRFAW